MLTHHTTQNLFVETKKQTLLKAPNSSPDLGEKSANLEKKASLSRSVKEVSAQEKTQTRPKSLKRTSRNVAAPTSVHHLCIISPSSKNHQCIICLSKAVHHQRIISASSAHHQCIISTSRVHHECIMSASTGHLQCIYSASTVHHQ